MVKSLDESGGGDRQGNNSMNVYSADGGPLVRDGRLNLAPEVAKRLGIPANLEAWRYEIARGAADPEAYGRALKQADSTGLHASSTMLDAVEVVARRNPGTIVPLHLDAEFHAILYDLRARVRAEASARGLTLVPWSSAQVQQ
jgi:hypothetical protein